MDSIQDQDRVKSGGVSIGHFHFVLAKLLDMTKRVSATMAKNRFGDVMRMAEAEPVYIVKHGKARSVVVNAEQYEALARKGRDPQEKVVEGLRKEFDAMVAGMQTKRSRKAFDRLLSASAEELNAIAAKVILSKRAKAPR